MSEETQPVEAQGPDLAKTETTEYRNILPEYQKYHQLGPKDMSHGKPEEILFQVQVQRQTSSLGEQFAIQIPVFATDSRDDLRARTHLAYSIIQERLEDENKVLMNLQQKAQDQKMAERERIHKLQQEKKFEKLVKKGKIKLAPQPTPEA